MKELRTYTQDGKVYTYTLTRKKVKNLTLRIKQDHSISLSAPLHTPPSRIEEFFAAHVGFIEKAFAKFDARREHAPQPLILKTGESLPIWGVSHTVHILPAKRRAAYTENGTLFLCVKNPACHEERLRAFAEFLDREAKANLAARTAALTPLFAPKPPKPPQLTFRTMKTKWGVCRPREGRVTLNRNLVYLPPSLVDYVICHELAHFHHADHSAAFWQCLAAVMPDCKARRKALNAFAIPKLEEPSAS